MGSARLPSGFKQSQDTFQIRPSSHLSATYTSMATTTSSDGQQQVPPAHNSTDAAEDELEWTQECNTLIGQVLETQSEISSLLKTHGDNTESLVAMKKECDEELVELQEDAWKLQMLVELQRMGQQLERLASHEDEASPTKDPDAAGEHAAKEGGSAAAGSLSTGDEGSKHVAELQDLDKEIEDLDRQLVAARAELAGLMHDKVALEGEVVMAGQQLEALALQEA